MASLFRNSDASSLGRGLIRVSLASTPHPSSSGSCCASGSPGVVAGPQAWGSRGARGPEGG